MLERALQTSHALRVFLPALWCTAQRDAPQVLSALDSRWGLLVLSSSQQIKHWLHGGEKHSAFWIRMSICICSEKCPRLTAAPSLPCVFISFHVNQPSLRILFQTPRIPELPPSSLRHLPSPRSPTGAAPSTALHPPGFIRSYVTGGYFSHLFSNPLGWDD